MARPDRCHFRRAQRFSHSSQCVADLCSLTTYVQARWMGFPQVRHSSSQSIMSKVSRQTTTVRRRSESFGLTSALCYFPNRPRIEQQGQSNTTHAALALGIESIQVHSGGVGYSYCTVWISNKPVHQVRRESFENPREEQQEQPHTAIPRKLCIIHFQPLGQRHLLMLSLQARSLVPIPRLAVITIAPKSCKRSIIWEQQDVTW